jgi:hypothetical protein
MLLVESGDLNHFFERRVMALLFRNMNRLPQHEMIRALKAQLHHFDHSPDFGDGEAVQAIRRHLLQRIREAEGALRRPPWLGLELKSELDQVLNTKAA